MIDVVAFLGIGLLLVIVLLLLFRRPSAPKLEHNEPCEADELSHAVSGEVFPKELANRLFGPEDWEFIAKQRSSRLQREFLRQRKGLALSWLRIVLANATKLIRVHIRAARKSSELEPLDELRVVAEYLVIQLLCLSLGLAIWLRGPVNLNRLVGYADNLLKRLYNVTARLLPDGLIIENDENWPHYAGRHGGA